MHAFDILKTADPAAAETFVEFGRHLGAALRTVLAAFAPRVIVLGGIARSAQLFLSVAQAEIGNLGAQLCVSALGDKAALVGAGAAWFQDGRPLSPRAEGTATHADPRQT